LNLTVSPGSRTTGVLKPLSENPVPEETIEEMVTVDAPEFESVSWIVSVVPFCTLPKLKALGFAVNVLGSDPVPVRATLIGAVWSVLIERFPACAPLLFGANVTLKVAVCPGANVTGSVMPATV
jgi:hypothetical protein